MAERRSRQQAALIRELDVQIAAAAAGSIAATKLLAMKAKLLGLPEKSEKTAEIPSEPDSDWVRIPSGGFVSRQNAMQTYGSGFIGTPANLKHWCDDCEIYVMVSEPEQLEKAVYWHNKQCHGRENEIA